MFMIVTVTVLATQVVVTLSRVQNLHLNEVKDESDASNGEHLGAHNLWGHKESLCRLDEKPDGHYPDRCD